LNGEISYKKDEISYKYVERLYSDEQVKMVLHNVFMLMLKKAGVSGKFGGDGTGEHITGDEAHVRRKLNSS
jgi:transposase